MVKCVIVDVEKITSLLQYRRQIKKLKETKMAFCEFSSEVVGKNSITIDNIFVTDFLPNASENCVKVYLYGLYLCSTSRDNSIENFAKAMNMSEEDLVSVFYYWQEQGLVQVLNIDPIQIRYLPVKNSLQKMKKYNVDKYTAFNISAQEIIGKKMLTPRELEEFYYLIENLNQEKEAVLKIIDFCVKQKGEGVSINYITTVAKNWAYDGVKTSADVDERILDQERISGDIVLLLKAMGIRRQATVDEYQSYLDWTKNMEIEKDLIIHIAKKSKSKSFSKLGEFVMKCYSSKLESVQEIDQYFDMRDNMYQIAKSVVKNLGLWYEDLSVIVDTYIANWLQLGFDEDMLIALSSYAFKSSIRTLEGLNNQVLNMFKLGVLTTQALDNHLAEIVKNDEVIANILSKLNLDRNVNSTDRSFYKTWLYDWNLSNEVIEYAVGETQGKYMPMQYLNKLLSEYHNKNVSTIDEAKKVKLEPSNQEKKVTQKSSAKEAKKRDYSKKQLDSLFTNIYEVEI